ncbi:MAG: GNAT family N-acetyltransferase [Actinophytocola sp.]|nr:GNAT family N-acetyltransferase [Actinophytocola sp.]
MASLAEAQTAVHTGLDPRLPAMSNPPPGTAITASLPDGRAVAGSVYRSLNAADAVESLWEPRTVWEFSPLIGDTGSAGMAAALAAMRAWLAGDAAEEIADPDTAIEVMWPSRDVGVAPALLGHGFVPMTTLAVRTGRHDDPGAGRAEVDVRRATMTDLPELVAIELAELDYSLRVIGGTMRSNAEELLTTALRRAVFFGGRVLIAESGGVAVGAVDCGVASPAPGSSIEYRLREGRWGYVGTLSVVPAARGTGVGRVLMAAAHAMLAADADAGTYLFYDLANPLSSAFWPRQGYRPLWTKWVCKPAARMR